MTYYTNLLILYESFTNFYLILQLLLLESNPLLYTNERKIMSKYESLIDILRTL